MAMAVYLEKHAGSNDYFAKTSGDTLGIWFWNADHGGWYNLMHCGVSVAQFFPWPGAFKKDGGPTQRLVGLLRKIAEAAFKDGAIQ